MNLTEFINELLTLEAQINKENGTTNNKINIEVVSAFSKKKPTIKLLRNSETKEIGKIIIL